MLEDYTIALLQLSLILHLMLHIKRKGSAEVTLCLLASIKLGVLTSSILLSLVCECVCGSECREHSPEGIPAQEQPVRSDQMIASHWQIVRRLHICRNLQRKCSSGSLVILTFDLYQTLTWL